MDRTYWQFGADPVVHAAGIISIVRAVRGDTGPVTQARLISGLESAGLEVTPEALARMRDLVR